MPVFLMCMIVAGLILYAPWAVWRFVLATFGVLFTLLALSGLAHWMGA